MKTITPEHRQIILNSWLKSKLLETLVMWCLQETDEPSQEHITHVVMHTAGSWATQEHDVDAGGPDSDGLLLEMCLCVTKRIDEILEKKLIDDPKGRQDEN